MPVKVGRMDRRVTLQDRSVSPSSFGEPVPAWVDVAELWAAIEPLGSSEIWRAQAAESDATHRVTIRYRAGVTSRMRLIYGSRTFEIDSVANEGEKDRVLTLVCREGKR